MAQVPPDPKPDSVLVSANTHAVANTGAVGVVAAVCALGAILSNPSVLLGLYHRDSTSISQVAAALVAILFAALATYLGRPGTIPS